MFSSRRFSPQSRRRRSTVHHFRSLRPLLVALVPGQQKLLTRLKLQRAELANELADVINTFGPQMYEDFDEVRNLLRLSCLGSRYPRF